MRCNARYNCWHDVIISDDVNLQITHKDHIHTSCIIYVHKTYLIYINNVYVYVDAFAFAFVVYVYIYIYTSIY